MSEGDETHCLKLDSILKNELPMDALEMDRKLSQLQNFILEAYSARETGPRHISINDTTGFDIPMKLIDSLINEAERPSAD